VPGLAEPAVNLVGTLHALATREGIDAPAVPQGHRLLTRSASGRNQVAHVPLFSSYVFLYGNELDRHRAMASNCVSRWLAVPDPTGLTQDLQQIQRLLETGVPVTPEARLAPGTHVRIRSGPLTDMEGVVIKRLHQWRLVVSVNFLQQGASLLLEDWQIERLD